MIKLKDILAESNNIQLQKVITAKDQPAFMTEEQFNKKWTSLIQESRWSEEYINKLEESMVLNETIMLQEFGPKDPDNKWVKDQWGKMPHRGKIRKAMIKFVMMLRPNSRSTHHLKRYFATGKISKQAASQVFRDWSLVVDKSLTGIAAVIWGGIYAATSINGVTVLLIPMIKSILGVAQALIMPNLLPGGSEAQRHLIKRLNKGADFLNKRAKDSAKTKASIDKINKRIKQVKSDTGAIFKM